MKDTGVSNFKFVAHVLKFPPPNLFPNMFIDNCREILQLLIR